MTFFSRIQSNRRGVFFGVAMLTGLLFSGCATTYVDTLFEYHEAKPRSILVVPVVNNSVDVLAATSVLSTLPKLIGEKGYYVFPVNTVKTLLEFEGYYEPAAIHNQPPQDLATLFSADAILYVVIHEWASKYLVFSTTTEVDFEYKIVSHDGVLLWQARKKLSYTPESDSSSGSFFGDIIAAAVTSALERANPNYLPLTKEANANVFVTGPSAIPPGPYSPTFEEYYQSVAARALAAEQHNSQ